MPHPHYPSMDSLPYQQQEWPFKHVSKVMFMVRSELSSELSHLEQHPRAGPCLQRPTWSDLLLGPSLLPMTDSSLCHHGPPGSSSNVPSPLSPLGTCCSTAWNSLGSDLSGFAPSLHSDFCWNVRKGSPHHLLKTTILCDFLLFYPGLLILIVLIPTFHHVTHLLTCLFSFSPPWRQPQCISCHSLYPGA